MDKSLQKRRQTKPFQGLHDDVGKEIKHPSKKEDQTKTSEHKDVPKGTKTSVRPASRDGTKVISSNTSHEVNMADQTRARQISHTDVNKSLRKEKEHAKTHLIQPEKPARSRAHESTPVNTNVTSHAVKEPLKRDAQKGKRHGIAEENVEDKAHENRAFEADEILVQVSCVSTVEASPAQTQTSKYSTKDELKVGTSNGHRQGAVSPNKPKYSQGDVTSGLASKINEIARFKEINYGSCTFAEHPQRSADPASNVDLFHHDDVFSSNLRCVSDSSSVKENQDTLGYGDMYVSKQQACHVTDNDITFHPAPLSPQHTEICQTEGSSQPIKTRKLPSLFSSKKPEVNAGTTRGRSNSLVPYLDPNSDLRLALQSSRPVGRSQSMRLPSTSKSEKPKKLLRELTFSDDDTTSLRNYGTLRGKNSLPKRQSSALMKRVSTIQEEDSDRPKISSEVKAQLLNLMQELLVRGKITQVGIIDQDTASLILSLPAWNLSTADIIGLIKAAGNTQEIMLKLNIGREMYTCFKHGANKMVGRVGEKILVAQKTHTCVIVGIADHDTPGSCMYEVSELANALMDKDW
ncbi:hypothetical protein Bpfe_018496 [Biomphalaria pfeifferi]|uniref:Profilin n=1 Tax=Biomphalaria pfeifferi TaxID=112525 RepID=A0AAD8BCY9_BIOPF|nr:hypothetical protein Bpfe_018496 [Biomphalaria pfeifferi]